MAQDVPTKSAVTSNSTLDDFKKLVRKALFLERSEEAYFQMIPDAIWNQIFTVNFESNLAYASRVILNQYKDIEKIDAPRVDREKNKIHSLDPAASWVSGQWDAQRPVLFITDFDNDGSLSQAVLLEYLEMDPDAAEFSHIEYAQSMPGNPNRGFTLELVDKIVTAKGWGVQDDFLIVTADNGINSRDEQDKILAKYPNAKLIVTDHHNPEPEMVVQEGPRSLVVNPKLEPTPFFQKYNISGANTLAVLMKTVLSKRLSLNKIISEQRHVENINTISKVANLLDYVFTSPVDKPEEDYIITKFLQLQPLLNINNSISKIITGGIDEKTMEAVQNKNEALDRTVFEEASENIRVQNQMARMLLEMHRLYQARQKDIRSGRIEADEASLPFHEAWVEILTQNPDTSETINPNFIEQLRPLIFQLSANDDKDIFLDQLNEKMIDVFRSIKGSEQSMARELRHAEIISTDRLKNSVIVYADESITRMFNRKFLNKVYNDENPGFSLTLDSVGKERVSGSFRSLFNISDIIRGKEVLEKELNVRIETPGHERAAGFIVHSLDPNQPITEQTLKTINRFIDRSIEQLRVEIKAQAFERMVTDLSAIHLIDRINLLVRGNISNFERICPLIQLTSDTIWTDSYTTEQFSMEELVSNQKYGYVSINTNFDGHTVIVPIELIRKIVDRGYQDYLSLGYMDGGVFIVDRVVIKEEIKNLVDLREKDNKSDRIAAVFEKHFKETPIVKLNREQIKDNPFFKYNTNGHQDFEMFERMVIEVIESHKVETLAVFDVEANGFGNSKLMNFGAMNYSINPDTGITCSEKEFHQSVYRIASGSRMWLTAEDRTGLKPVSLKAKEKMDPALQRKLLVKKSARGVDQYFLHPKITVQHALNEEGPAFPIMRNLRKNGDGTITYNRELRAEMLAYLVKDRDFKVPQVMTNLTGITQDLLDRYGMETHLVDKSLAQYYQGKSVLFGAHNTPYDARVMRANAPGFYQFMKKSKIYDSALFSKDEKLAYDNVQVARFNGVEGVPNNVFFYNNKYSDFSLTHFLEKNENGYYPDRTNQYLLENENGVFSLIDKKNHKKIKLPATSKLLTDSMETLPLPNTSVKYSVEKLSEQWMIRLLLLADEGYNLVRVDLKSPHFKSLKKHEEALVFFQDHYFFGASPEANLSNFRGYYPELDDEEIQDGVLEKFMDEFLESNKDIQQKFSDAWIYKKVLEIKDPSRAEVTNDLVELVAFQTHLPKDKIRTIFDAAIRFKEKYKIPSVLQHEGHINGLWEGDEKGDVAFEDKLTFSLLTKKMYNFYNHDMDEAVAHFNRYQLRAQMAFDVSDHFSEGLAQDSYSYRQGLQYDREEVSSMVKKIQEKEKGLGAGSEPVIKFRLANEIIPQDSGVYAIPRNGIVLDRKQIEEDAGRLNFILLHTKIWSSLKNIKNKSAEDRAREMLKCNWEQISKYKEELSSRYRHIEFNRRDEQFKKLLDAGLEGLVGELKIPKIKDLSREDCRQIKSLLENQIKHRESVAYEVDEEARELVMKTLDGLISTMPDTPLEKALANPAASFSVDGKAVSDEKYQDIHFLSEVQISLREPLKTLLDKHPDLKMMNRWVQDQFPPAPRARIKMTSP